MAIEIKQIEVRKQWEDFINTYEPHTFLQNWEWKLSQEVMGNKTFTLGIFDEDSLVGTAFIYKIKAKRGTFLFCPHGPLIKNDFGKYFKELFAYLKELARKEKVDFIRIAPLEKETEKLNSFFEKFGFKNAPMHMHPELAWMLDVTKSEEELLRGMKKRTRYSITKALKDGVTIVRTENLDRLDEFYKIYIETANRQSFVPFSKSYVKKEFEIFKEEGKIALFFAQYKGETVATAMVVYDNGSGFYHHGASVRKYSNITASELLQWNAILEAKRRGMKLYNFWGIVPDDAKNHPWIGLSRFKKGFGGFSEAYVHAKDYPVTLKYWLNYAIETLRRIKRKY